MTNNMNHQNKKRNVALAVVAGVATVLVAAGCQGNKHPSQQVSHGEQFIAEGTPRSVDKFVNTQFASGARADATLQPCHFDGNQINSLGRDKLRAMLRDDDAAEPLVVYVNVPGDSKARHEAVLAFLTDEGLLESQIQVKDGGNPGSTISTAKAMKALATADGEGAAGAPPAPAPGAAPSGTAAPK